MHTLGSDRLCDVLTAGLAARCECAMQTAPDRYSPTHSHVSLLAKCKDEVTRSEFSRLLHRANAHSGHRRGCRRSRRRLQPPHCRRSWCRLHSARSISRAQHTLSPPQLHFAMRLGSMVLRSFAVWRPLSDDINGKLTASAEIVAGLDAPAN